MGSEKKYRYPGINFFTREDQDIFCGRADDAQKLFNRVMLNNTLVLHGESGTGKSSLVQAGLVPLLEKRNAYLQEQHKPQYLPVTIRLDSIMEITNREESKTTDDNEILVRQILNSINENNKYQAKELPYISRKDNSFWYTAKLFEKNNYTLLLILDQFEELQGYTYKEAEVLAQKLSELFVSTMPEDIYKEYDKVTADLVNEKEMTEDARKEYNQCVKFLEQPLNVRILFVVREDKLGTMSLLSDYFPDILKNDFFLLPLDKNGARRAIAEPAQKKGNFISDQFTIDDEAVDLLLQSLVDPNTKLYDPIQLQIVCSSIEKKVAPKKELIKKEDIPEIKDIISEFYNDTWNGIRIELKLVYKQYELKRKGIISELVVSGKRNLVLKNLLISDDNEQDENIIRSLVREGMLRKIPSGKDVFYQLSHDRLITPLSEDVKNLEAKENAEKEIEEQKARAKKRKLQGLIIATSLLIIATLIAIYFAMKASGSARDANRSEKYAERDKHLLISTVLGREDNPTLSYIIARDWLEQNLWSDTMKRYVQSFDSADYVYLTGIYPALSEVIYAGIDSENMLTVNEVGSQSVWDIKKNFMIEKKLSNEKVLIKRIVTRKDGFIDLVDIGESVIIKDQEGRDIAKFKKDYLNWENTAISPDTRYLLVENKIFFLGTAKLLTTLPPYKLYDQQAKTNETQDEYVSLFVDNNRIVTGYDNGDIVIYEINANSNPIIKIVDKINSPDPDRKNYRINALAFDRSKHCLLVANSQNSIDVYDLDKVESRGQGEETDLDRDSLYVTTFSGHNGPVSCMVFSSDSALLLTGSEDNTAILWNTDNWKRMATLNGPGADDVKSAFFLHADKDIITISGNNKVYLWKRGQPTVLYKKNQLYRFSPYNYYVWLLNEEKDGRMPDITSTRGLYSVTLNYLLNFPSGNKYPDEENYTNSLKMASAEIKSMYDKLVSRKDYADSIPGSNQELLEKYYTSFLPKIERDIKRAKLQIDEWEIFFSDTTERSNVNRLIAPFSLIASSYLDRQSNYPDALRLLNFYSDSVLKPMLDKHSENTYVKVFRRSMNIQWLKYYLYTGKPDTALEIFNELLQTPSRAVDNNIYLVATYLVLNKYDSAAKQYNDIIKNRKLRRENDRNLQGLLTSLKEKNIAVSSIEKFANQFELELE